MERETRKFSFSFLWVVSCTWSRYYANLRRKNTGRDEPHNIKYWGLGNEVYGEWQVGQQTAEAYAAKARQWARAIKLLDPMVRLIACGENGLNRWDGVVLDEIVDKVDGHRCVKTQVITEQETEARLVFTCTPASERGIVHRSKRSLVGLSMGQRRRSTPLRSVKH
jgi:hypothetical protein